MSVILHTLGHLDDPTLLTAIKKSAQENCHVLLQLLLYLGKAEARALHAACGFDSLFSYCQSLGFSEGEAYARCTVARAERRYPLLLEAVGAGRLHLSGAALLARRLTPRNVADLVSRASKKSKRQIEALLADLFGDPRAARARPVIRRCRSQSAGADATTASAATLRPGSVELPRLQQKSQRDVPTSASQWPPLTAAVPKGEPWRAGARLVSGCQNVSTPSPAPPPKNDRPLATAEQEVRLHVTLPQQANAHLQQAREMLQHRLPGADVS